jgi:hypothetical protein
MKTSLAHDRRSPLPLVGAILAVILAAGAVLAAIAIVPARAATAGTPVMGKNVLTAHQLAVYYYDRKGHDFARIPTLNGDVERLAQLFIDEGRKDGVRGDIAFAQSMLETGWLYFNDRGQIRPDFNNFAGMYAYDGRPIGTTCAAEEAEDAAGGDPSRCFPSPEIGVRTQIHKLRSYADPSVANTPGRLAYAPSDRRGIAPYWEQFGGASGIAIWATAPDYGEYIVDRMYMPMLAFFGKTFPCTPAGSTTTGDAGDGYWVVGATGRSYAFGSAPALGGAAAAGAGTPVVAAAATPSGAGYWQATRGGGVFPFGDARARGSLARANLAVGVVGIEATSSGDGYWLATEDGGVFPFGDAPSLGSLANKPLRAPVVAFDRTPSGNGYWLLTADGEIHAYGDAGQHGSPQARGITADLIAIASTPTGAGYYVLSDYGHLYAFGDATRSGDVYGCGFGRATDVVAAPTGDGYWITTAGGLVVAFGSARQHGSPASVDGGAVAFVVH